MFTSISDPYRQKRLKSSQLVATDKGKQ